MKTLLDKLKEKISTQTKEEIKSIWDSGNHLDSIGVKINDFFNDKIMIINLIPMIDFVLQENEINVIKNYAKFLKQKPEKWMFFPCDEDGNVLEDLDKSIHAPDVDEYREYIKAKERVLFEHPYSEDFLFNIECRQDLDDILFYYDENFKLTETAKKMIYEK